MWLGHITEDRFAKVFRCPVLREVDKNFQSIPHAELAGEKKKAEFYCELTYEISATKQMFLL